MHNWRFRTFWKPLTEIPINFPPKNTTRHQIYKMSVTFPQSICYFSRFKIIPSWTHVIKLGYHLIFFAHRNAASLSQINCHCLVRYTTFSAPSFRHMFTNAFKEICPTYIGWNEAVLVIMILVLLGDHRIYLDLA